MNLILKSFVLISVLSCSMLASAGFDEGLAAAQRGDFQTARKEWRPLAEQGNASAQFNLGLMYANGQGVLQDYAQAVSWYRKAAEQGHARAQTNLGFMYENGHGVPQDYAQALSWFRKAAEQGDAMARFNVGEMYALMSGKCTQVAKE